MRISFKRTIKRFIIAVVVALSIKWTEYWYKNNIPVTEGFVHIRINDTLQSFWNTADQSPTPTPTAIMTTPVTSSVDACNCTDKRTSDSHAFCYQCNVTRPFNCNSMQYLRPLRLLNDKPSEIDMPLAPPNANSTFWLEEDSDGRHRRVAYVTAASTNHSGELLQFLNEFRRVNPGQTLIVYDIGLSTENQTMVKSLCFVEYRRFDFAKYPPSVRNLREYRWKPLMIAEILQSYYAVWWMDTSVRRPKTCNMKEVLSSQLHVFYVVGFIEYKTGVWTAASVVRVRLLVTIATLFQDTEKLLRKMRLMPGGTLTTTEKLTWLLFDKGPYTVDSATHPAMYDFLGDAESAIRIKKVSEYCACFMFIARSPITYQILRWFVLCALETDCMGPPNATVECGHPETLFSHRMDVLSIKQGKLPAPTTGCRRHRFDQSAINVLLEATKPGRSTTNFYNGKSDIGFLINRDDTTPIEAEKLKCISEKG